MHPEDSELIGRFQRGETAAFELLVRRYQRPLFTFLLRFTGDREAARDLFQETFLRMLRGLPDYDEGRLPAGVWSLGTHRRRRSLGRVRLAVDEQARAN